jgi:hypothetical protein
MTDNTTDTSFEFERLLKILAPVINESQKITLEKWNLLDQDFKSSWLTFSYVKTRDNAVIAKEKLTLLLAFAPELNNCISSVFMALPDPSDAVGLWDEGKERRQRQQYEDAIVSIKDITVLEYINANATLPTLDSVIDQTPIEPTNLETFLVIENGTAEKINISTAITSENSWANGTFRPDINFNNITIDEFSYLKQREDIKSFSLAAEFIVNISLLRGNNQDKFNFTADQSKAGNANANNKNLVVSGPSATLYSVIQSVSETAEGVKGLVITIVEKRGE